MRQTPNKSGLGPFYRKTEAGLQPLDFFLYSPDFQARDKIVHWTILFLRNSTNKLQQLNKLKQEQKAHKQQETQAMTS